MGGKVRKIRYPPKNASLGKTCDGPWKIRWYIQCTPERASVVIQVVLFQRGPIFFRGSIFGTKISQSNEAVEAQELSGLLTLEQFGD